MSRKLGTLIVDEIPAILAGTAEGQPPGRLVHLDADGSVLFETTELQMPYGAAPAPDGGWASAVRQARPLPNSTHTLHSICSSSSVA